MTQTDQLDILARPGANEQVLSKKVLLAILACAEAERLGVTPDVDFVAAIQHDFLAGLDLEDGAELTQWLTEAGLDHAQFQRVLQDFAAIVAVERLHAEALPPRLELHRRLVVARMRRLDTLK